MARGFLSIGSILLLIFAGGCGGDAKQAGKAEMSAPMVTVDHPVTKSIVHYEYVTGRTEPLEQVEIRARVNGYLQEIRFTAGQEIEKGKPMYLIDPEPYKADLAKAKANLATAQADLANSNADLSRAKSRLAFSKNEYERFRAAGSGASASEVDKSKSSFDEADSTVKSSEAKIKFSEAKIEEANASIRTAELNLGYCTIDAPIGGICGDTLVTKGNLITGGGANDTLLTTIVAVEKMDAAFDIDENTLQRIQQSVREGILRTRADGYIQAEAGLAVHGKAYPLLGSINFSDNKFDAKTGTIRAKARFDNPVPPVGKRLLSAGMYTRIRVPLGEPVSSILVPDSAISSDQGIPYIYLIGPENKAIRCDAVTGQLEGELRIIESIQYPGDAKPRPLTTADTVIVTGIQRVRNDMVVDPKPARK